MKHTLVRDCLGDTQSILPDDIVYIILEYVYAVRVGRSSISYWYCLA